MKELNDFDLKIVSGGISPGLAAGLAGGFAGILIGIIFSGFMLYGPDLIPNFRAKKCEKL